MADGVGHDHGTHKLQTALVSKWPEAFDIENDIVKQGRADTFQRSLKRKSRYVIIGTSFRQGRDY